jgi:hypothetical protein
VGNVTSLLEQIFAHIKAFCVVLQACDCCKRHMATEFCQEFSAYSYEIIKGNVIAQAVSRRLPTAAARIRAQLSLCEISGGQSGTGAGFILVLRFLLLIIIPPTAPHSFSFIRGWRNRPICGRRTEWTK